VLVHRSRRARLNIVTEAKCSRFQISVFVIFFREEWGCNAEAFHTPFGGSYYDTQSLENLLKPQCLLASRMNGQPLPQMYGAPLRLRIENQLGYKMVKWIERIEFIESEKSLGKGEGGKNEDDEYFDLLPNI
jgi:hypothetical protein